MTPYISSSKYLTKVSNINRLSLENNKLIINQISYKLPQQTLNRSFLIAPTTQNLIYENKLTYQFFLKFVINRLKEYRLSYCNILELFGLSFTTTIKKNKLRLNIGYNHSIYYIIPKDVIIHTKKKYIYIYSSSLQRLNFVISELINFRKINAYKLKGIKVKDSLYIKKKKKLSN